MKRLIGWSAALALATALAACDAPGGKPAQKLQFQGTDITGATYARSLSLQDVDGRTRTLDDFKGKVVVVFFGYTQCPDVCPTTMGELALIKRALGADGDRLQGIFVTVDPARDTPEVLKAYLAAFDPSFVGLRGSPEQVAAAAREFKVFYAKVPGTTPGSYTMDHTAGTYVIDAKGNLRLFERYGMPAEQLQSDLKQLLAGA